jgi:hypothetical protein
MSEKGLYPYPLDQIVYALLIVGNFVAIYLHPEMMTVGILGVVYFSYQLLKPAIIKRRLQIAESAAKEKSDKQTKF